MSELRQDPLTGEWVLLAPERAKRPHHAAQAKGRQALPVYDASCPFCPGNEADTPPEVLRLEIAQQGDSAHWNIRVVPNRFPALAPQGTTALKKAGDLFQKMDGFGVHEVIIESPRHNASIPSLEDREVAQIISAYQARYNALKGNSALRFILIFKNQGQSAGTSLAHLHSQLMATPIIPQHIGREFELATGYHAETGRCLYCDVFQSELNSGERIVAESRDFFVFHPYASRHPYETWIAPKNHTSSFGLVPTKQLDELAQVLKKVLLGIEIMLDNPDFNYMICSSPTETEVNPYYDWHLIILPRLSIAAGFEIGSGIYINTALPEETAELMRKQLA